MQFLSFKDIEFDQLVSAFVLNHYEDVQAELAVISLLSSASAYSVLIEGC